MLLVLRFSSQIDFCMLWNCDILDVYELLGLLVYCAKAFLCFWDEMGKGFGSEWWIMDEF